MALVRVFLQFINPHRRRPSIRTRRSISIPIGLGIFTVLLSITLLVGWILVIVQNLYLTGDITPNAWLIALGSLSFVAIITVLVWLSVFLVREIRMVNRQNRFLDSVTHELKSPLASLKLGLETLERTDLSGGQRSDVHQMMVDDVERLTIFINDILQAGRATQREGYPLEKLNLRGLVEDSARGILRHYRQPSEAIEVRVPTEIELITDRTALGMVIMNLLDNAVKYSLGLDRDVRVTAEASAESKYVHIEIRDRGMGIPRSQLKKVFERFYRIPGEAVRAHHGTGLGLYVVSSVIRVLGGKIKAVSDGQGTGASIHVWLPAKQRAKRVESGVIDRGETSA